MAINVEKLKKVGALLVEGALAGKEVPEKGWRVLYALRFGCGKEGREVLEPLLRALARRPLKELSERELGLLEGLRLAGKKGEAVYFEALKKTGPVWRYEALENGLVRGVTFQAPLGEEASLKEAAAEAQRLLEKLSELRAFGVYPDFEAGEFAPLTGEQARLLERLLGSSASRSWRVHGGFALSFVRALEELHRELKEMEVFLESFED